MKKIFYFLSFISIIACSKRDEDVTEITNPQDFPKVIILSDEFDADNEDNDAVGIAMEMLPIWSESNPNVDGEVLAPSQTVRVFFKVFDYEGPSEITNYILGGKAFYEIDDCTTSEDENIELNFVWNADTQEGSFDWPAGIAEIEVEFEVDPLHYDDAATNDGGRGFSFELTSIQTNDSRVKLQDAPEFRYHVIDEEGIFISFDFDFNDPAAFEAFKSFFGNFDSDINDLEASAIDAIEFSFDHEKLEMTITLIETEEDECDAMEMVNVEIQVELEYDFDFEDLINITEYEGTLVGEIETDDLGSAEVEVDALILFNGTNEVVITLAGESVLGEIEEQTITLTR
jgi:hypothetical protein